MNHKLIFVLFVHFYARTGILYSNSFWSPSVPSLGSPQYPPQGSPQYPPHHNIPWQGRCVSHEHSSIVEKEPGHLRFFSVVHLAAAFRRAVKKNTLFSIKIDKCVLTNENV